MADDKPDATDTEAWALSPEHHAAATQTLAQILRWAGTMRHEPGALFGLHALLGCVLLRFSHWSTGQMVDMMQRYAADDQLVAAIAEVLRREGVLPSSAPAADGTPDKPLN